MTSQPAEPTYQSDSISLSSPAQVAASIPYMLGFWPSESVVGMFFDESNHMVLTARADFPSVAGPVDISAAFSDCCLRAVAQGATQVQVVAFPEPKMPLPRRVETLVALEEIAATASLDVLDVGSVLDGHWVSSVGEQSECAALEDESEELIAACQWISRGVTYASDREALADVIVGEPTDLAIRAEQFMREGGAYFAKEFLRTRGQRREIEDLIFDFVTLSHPQWVKAPKVSDSPLNPELVVLWAQAVNDRRVREPLLWRIAVGENGHGENAREAAAALCTITRNTPPEIAAAVASCTAAVAWQSGNGALARIAAAHGVACEPRNVLSGLVLDAVSNGVHPGVWVEMLRSMPLAELRATVKRRRK